MATWRDWGKLKINGGTLASNFSSIDSTNEHSVEFFPKQLTRAGEVLASFGSDYYNVILDHFEDGVVYIRINGKIYKVEPGLSINEEIPLSYAWSQMHIEVTEPFKEPKVILETEDASEEQILYAVDWCLDNLNETTNKMLEQAADHLYLPKYRILDHNKAKLCYSFLAERSDCEDKVRYKSYCRLARISYLALEEDAGDKFAAIALEIYPQEIEPLMLGVDYEWFKHIDENYSDLYRNGKLPRIKALVEARHWQAMAYLLDKILPLQDEGMKANAELCETVLKETFRKSDERNFDAIAPVAFWKFIESEDYPKFKKSWYYKQLEKGIQRSSKQSFYYYAFIQEIKAQELMEEGKEEDANPFILKSARYYIKGIDLLDRRAKAGISMLAVDFLSEDPQLSFYIKCLRAFSYKNQIYPFLDREKNPIK